ncbi:mevalonate kinase [Nocardia sp. CS682]|uniref:mevalonate kinase n=1 Tax=Nocardia sp. CS682 TaxID=1047172 RepID=UPI001075486B|nr:mevalonate kinase [Nocardia sp. CS682]QBS39521.1 mevalonate kinase [Nocardia sp. CS682]
MGIEEPAVGTGRAHGKAILLGEHTVVYGSPAIAVPLPALTATARARAGTGFGFGVGTCAPEPGASYRFRIAAGNPAEQGSDFRAAVEAALSERELPREGVELALWCTIPVQRGLGASAACTAACVRAVTDMNGSGIEATTLYRLVQRGEQVTHGRASGVDASAVISARPIWFEAGTARPIVTTLEAVLVVADTGIVGSTKQAVELVRRRLETDSAAPRLLTRAAVIIAAAAADLRTGDAKALGSRLNDFHLMLDRLGVSSPEIEHLVRAAREAGALGAKLTGGGLGGCVLALAENGNAAEKVADALMAAGAVRTWTVGIGGTAR